MDHGTSPVQGVAERARHGGGVARREVRIERAAERGIAAGHAEMDEAHARPLPRGSGGGATEAGARRHAPREEASEPERDEHDHPEHAHLASSIGLRKSRT